jgi:hypothetical protein
MEVEIVYQTVSFPLKCLLMWLPAVVLGTDLATLEGQHLKGFPWEASEYVALPPRSTPWKLWTLYLMPDLPFLNLTSWPGCYQALPSSLSYFWFFTAVLGSGCWVFLHHQPSCATLGPCVWFSACMAWLAFPWPGPETSLSLAVFPSPRLHTYIHILTVFEI